MYFFVTKYRKLAGIIFLCLVSLQSVAQQDPGFTQYMYNGQVINPAIAGIWEKTGFTALVREQWAGVDHTPLNQSISLHSPLKNEIIGIGLNIHNETFSRERKLSIMADYAYEIRLSPEKRLRLGVKFGFTNYKNSLTEIQISPDNQYDPVFSEDIDLKFISNFGAGIFFYEDNYFIGLSIPKFVENDFDNNHQNYSVQAEIRTLYINGGYVFFLDPFSNFIFKPTAMVRAGRDSRVQYDLAANLMIYQRLWVGLMLRSGNALSATSMWFLNKNLRMGFAMDITYNEIFPYQRGTFEFTMGYDIDFFGRNYVRAKYF